MANKFMPNGVGDWNPATPDMNRDSYFKMLEPDAKDAPDTWNATNELKRFVGKNGKMADPEPRGRDF